eukprot:5668-Heterococcus_DN1.PRE.2
MRTCPTTRSASTSSRCSSLSLSLASSLVGGMPVHIATTPAMSSGVTCWRSAAIDSSSDSSQYNLIQHTE